MKTIKEWLEELPEPYRKQALENMNNKNIGYKREKLSTSLYSAFHWARTPEGDKYWRDLYIKLKSDGK